MFNLRVSAKTGANKDLERDVLMARQEVEMYRFCQQMKGEARLTHGEGWVRPYVDAIQGKIDSHLERVNKGLAGLGSRARQTTLIHTHRRLIAVLHEEMALSIQGQSAHEQAHEDGALVVLDRGIAILRGRGGEQHWVTSLAAIIYKAKERRRVRPLGWRDWVQRMRRVRQVARAWAVDGRSYIWQIYAQLAGYSVEDSQHELIWEPGRGGAADEHLDARWAGHASVVGSETSWTNCCESDEGRMKEGAAMCEEGQGIWPLRYGATMSRNLIAGICQMGKKLAEEMGR
ncbi:predicted protein [Postia placenta Mad-698-R]|nr:predicted protein [Postia placenta Mad-698-R]